jgi:signal recognition particle subunit SRP54
MKELYGLLDSGTVPFVPQKGKTNVIMFVGLQGCGKTTTCTKFAYYYRKKGWKVALVCADTFRAGAFDQLKQNATKANIPFYGSHTESDPVAVAEAGVAQFREEKYELIIVDTSGRHKQEEALFEEMKDVAAAVQPDDVVFTMDSSIGQAAKDQAQAFKDAVAVGSVIITKLDGHAKGGGALSAVAATKSPIIFVGTGEHVDDLEAFNVKSFVQRLLGMGDLGGLMNLMQDAKVFENPGSLMKKLASGKPVEFTFRDMYEQFASIMKMGPPSKLFSMIPGMSNMMPKGADQDIGKNIKNFMTIMDSMSNTELDGDDKLFAASNKTGTSRITRISRGSGIDKRNVVQVLASFKPFKQVVSKLAALTKGGNDPNKMQANLAKMLPPQAMAKMGGMAGIKKMMGAMGGGGGGGMPDMASMMGGGGGGGGGMPDMSQMMQNMDPNMMQNMMSMMQGMMGGGQKKKVMRAKRR